MEPETEELEILTGFCPSCRKKGTFIYSGLQEGFDSIKDFKMYTCLNCQSTLDEKRIIKKWTR